MKASELRALPVNELEAKMTDLKEEYLRLRCGHVSRQLADVIMIKKTRVHRKKQQNGPVK